MAPAFAMTHLGAVLPLKGGTHLHEKVTKKVNSVLEFWKLETDIPLHVCVDQGRNLGNDPPPAAGRHSKVADPDAKGF
eukprot:gene18774-biopygen12979